MAASTAIAAIVVAEDVGDLGEARELIGLTISLSSSLIVSKIFDALRLMTRMYCGGATSRMNFAKRGLAISLVFRKDGKTDR